MKPLNSQSKIETLIAIITLLSLIFILFWRVIVYGDSVLATDLIFDLDPVWQSAAPAGFDSPGNELLSDQVYQFFPWADFSSRYENGFPLWNPLSYAGHPFISNAQSGLYNPFRLLTLFLSVPNAFSLSIILRLFVAGFATYLFARSIGLKFTGGLLAMITFTFSMPVVNWLSHPHSSVYVWLPTTLWLTERMIANRSWRMAFWLAFVIGFQFLGGHPETSFHLLMYWAIYWLYRAWTISSSVPTLRMRIQSIFKRSGRPFFALIAGFGIGAIQVIPFLAYLPHTPMLAMRAEAHSMGWRTLFFNWVQWPSVATGLIPQILGSPVDRSFWYPYSNSSELHLYVGFLPLVLAIFVGWQLFRKAIPHSIKWAALFFTGFSIFCLGVALKLPIFTLVNHLPIFDVAANGRLRIEYAFSMAILAGIGCSQFSDSQQTKKRLIQYQKQILRIAIGLSILAIIIISSLSIATAIFQDQIIAQGRAIAEIAIAQENPLFHHDLAYYYNRVEFRVAQMSRLFSVRSFTNMLPIIITGGLVIIFFLARKWQLKPRLIVLLLLILTSFDQIVVAQNYQPTIQQESVFPKTDAISFLMADQDLFRVVGLGLNLMPNSSMVFDLADIRGYDPLVPQRYLDLIRQSPGYKRISYYALWQNSDWHMYDLLNVKYFITNKQGGPNESWMPVYSNQQENIYIFENPSVLSRAFFVSDAVVVTSPQASLAQIADPNFNYKTTVVLEGDVTHFDMSAVKPVQAEVEIVDYKPDTLTVNVATNQPGYLVLMDTYMPGWQAAVNGETQEILIANHAFRGLALAAGEHEVDFQYWPVGFHLGGWFSLGSILVCLMGLIITKPPRHPRPRRFREIAN